MRQGLALFLFICFLFTGIALAENDWSHYSLQEMSYALPPQYSNESVDNLNNQHFFDATLYFITCGYMSSAITANRERAYDDALSSLKNSENTSNLNWNPIEIDGMAGFVFTYDMISPVELIPVQGFVIIMDQAMYSC